MKQFIIIFFCLFFSTNVFAKDFYRYFGFGQSTGSYEESKYNLDEDLSSDSYVYGNYFASDKSNLLSTTLFAQLTQFELQTTDREQQNHDLSVMLIGLNWAKGLSVNIDIGDHNLILDGSGFIGTGLIRASKTILYSDGRTHSNFPENYGVDFNYGTMLTLAFIYDGTVTFGVRQLYQDNNIYLDFDGNSGTVIQENTIEIFIGYASEPSPACVETKYSPCI